MNNRLFTGAMILFLGAALTAGAVVPASRTAAAPGQMNYQGRLVTSAGATYSNAVYNIEFRIWDNATGGSAQWGAKYATYVKDGYFNVILGGTGAQPVSTNAPAIYPPNELWRALWFDPSRANNNELYLGVTVFEGANGLPLPPLDVQEAFPRQILLSAPFAERAQSAEYAHRAENTFLVPGALTAAGGLAASGGVALSGGATVDNLAASGTLSVNNSFSATANGTPTSVKGLEVSGGTAYLRNGLDVTGSATLRGGATISGTLATDGNMRAANFEFTDGTTAQWKRIASVGLSGHTSYTFSSVNRGATRAYKVVFAGLIFPNGTDSYLMIRVNGSASNYHSYGRMDGGFNELIHRNDGFYLGRLGWGPYNAWVSVEYTLHRVSHYGWGPGATGHGEMTMLNYDNGITAFCNSGGAWKTSQDINSITFYTHNGQPLYGTLTLYAME
ncbi:MAG: hypothetical protein HQ523_02915 [Lentisphaerae bacterium]|nr:hypothetical protein [Lentisphaerota bacterium]